MAGYFFDTSALVKRHVNETGSGWVKDRRFNNFPKS
jgi:hypothetical protein